MRVARPTTITDKALNRVILIAGLGLLIGIPAFIGFYWLDRNVAGSAPVADQRVVAAEAAVKKDPTSGAARDMLGAAYVGAGRYQDGVDQFGEALKIDSKDRSALLGRGIAYNQLKQYDSAVKDFQTFIDQNGTGEFAKQDPQLEQAYYLLGAAQQAQGKWSDSVAAEVAALKIDSGDADALYTLGVGLIKTGDPAKATLALKKAASFVPVISSGTVKWCDPYTALVDAYTAQHSADGIAYANGMVALCTGNFAAAEQAFKPLVASKEVGTDAVLGLAMTAARSGDNAAAADYYRQVIAKDPSNQLAVIGLQQVGGTAPAASPAGAPASPASSAAAGASASPAASGSN